MIIATPWAHFANTHTYTTEIWNLFLKNLSSFLHRAKNKQRYSCSRFIALPNYEVYSFLYFVWLIVRQFVKFFSTVCNFSLCFPFSCNTVKEHMHTHTLTQEKLLNCKRFVLLYKTYIWRCCCYWWKTKKMDSVLLFFIWLLDSRIWNLEVCVCVSL